MHKLLKDLSRELRHAERNSNLTITSSPLSTAKAAIKASKVDQPIKRVRRKPQARADFVDINEALSNFAAEEVPAFLYLLFVLLLFKNKHLFLFLGAADDKGEG